MTQQPFAALTSAGQPVWYGDPARTVVLDHDLRHHLGRQCRYAGAVEWTVLQHLALCAAMARPHGPLVTAYAAAHDLHEAYLPDLPYPLVRILPDWEALEVGWQAHVHRAVGLPWPPPAQVAEIVGAIDRRAIVIEVHVAETSAELRETCARTLGGPPSHRELEVGRAQILQLAGLWRRVRAAVDAGVEHLRIGSLR